MNKQNQTDVVVYDDGELELKVSIDNDTVWLNRNQIAELFERDVKTIGKHIGNVFRDGEVEKISTVANFATVQMPVWNISGSIDMRVKISACGILPSHQKSIMKYSLTHSGKESWKNTLFW